MEIIGKTSRQDTSCNQLKLKHKSFFSSNNLMRAPFSALRSDMPNREQNMGECNAIGFHSSKKARVIKKLQTKFYSD